MGTPLGPKYIPYTYMDPLGLPFTRHGLLGIDGDGAPLAIARGVEWKSTQFRVFGFSAGKGLK